jgi:L-ascorbate metabolism protein UlaG (beta-lactamase superfamily)
MIAVYILLFILTAFFIITNLPVFGRLPKGLRLEKIHHLANYRDGALQNQSITLMQPEGVSFFKILNAFFFEKHPNKAPDKALYFITPNLNGSPKSVAPEIIWFGHSSYLIKVEGLRILVDPVFSKTPSPFSFIGSKAFLGTNVVKAEEFKNIDILLITHDHYDHLDYNSILKIAPQVKTIVTSLGVGEHLEKWGIKADKINELCWNESLTLFSSLKLTAVPARHFTGRKFKRNQTLWSAFVLKTENYQLFLGGDSGYDTHFAKIGEEFGPFDLALLECGQYNAIGRTSICFPKKQ